MELKMSSTVSNYASIFSWSSAFTQGWLRPRDKFSVATVTRSVRGVDEDRSRTFVETYADCFASDGPWHCLSSVAMETARPVLLDISPTGHKKASFYSGIVGEANSADKAYVEVSSDTNGSFRLNIGKQHGKVIGDSWFGGSCWSSDERYLVYVAQKKSEIKVTYFHENSDGKAQLGAKYDYVEDWGEKYDGVTDLSIFVLDTINKKVTEVSGIDSEAFTVGQPSFQPFAAGSDPVYRIVYTSWKTSPRKLGMIYCYQRPCTINVVDITKTLSEDAANLKSASHHVLSHNVAIGRSARFNSDGSVMVFLGSRKGFDSHNGCTELFSIDGKQIDDTLLGKAIQVKCVIEAVGNPNTSKSALPIKSRFLSTLKLRSSENKSSFLDKAINFPGIFADQLPSKCFLLDDNSVVVSSQWGSACKILVVSLATGAIEVLEEVSGDTEENVESGFTGNYESWNILDVYKNRMLVTRSTPSEPQRLKMFDLLANTIETVALPSKHDVVISKIEKATSLVEPARTDLDNLSWKVFRHEKDSIPFESILMYPKLVCADVGKMPIIVVPHGGPHSCTPTMFVASYAFLSLHLQVAVLHVNYRGSTGFGQDSIDSLLGKIGENDVGDLVASLEAILSASQKNDFGLPKFDSDKVGIVGGSHGGFLTGHMIGQFPKIFKVGCMRNPVTNIPAMVGVSDIPDWCFVETLGTGSYDFNGYRTATDVELKIMRERSPVFHMENIVAPTLLCLGAKDRRVPYSQGIDFYHMLKAKGVPTRMMIFPEDVHAIDKPASEADHWVAIADWIQKYLEL